ncbi:T-cell antigen CD7 [Colossoma macropomum]|uniref:T-cell antigen CD7 n=1 Tax=Colossoma macropomum TaxID=42526 RepID=UPI00186513F2|nr:T-cell antigen CD7 [Colossoma macropomum]
MMTLSVTLCFTAVLFSQYSAVLTAGPVTKNQGENLTMVCTTEDTDPMGLYLHLRNPEKHEVFYYDINSKTLTSPPEYEGRVITSGDPKELTVTITSLRENEMGVYTCVFNFFDGKRVEKETNGALVFVKAQEAVTSKVSNTEPSAMPEMLVLVSALTACTVVILCVLVTAVWIIPKVKALCARRRDNRSKAHNAVYEDMRAHRMQQI